MNRRGTLVAALATLWLAIASASNTPQNPPPQSQPQDRYPDGAITGVPWVVPAPERGVLPYTAVYRIDRWKEAKRAQEGDPNAIAKTFEWHIPVSTVEGTRAVAQKLLLAWQRLEERTYQHIMTRVNYTIGKTEVECVAKKALWSALKGLFGLNPTRPDPQVSALPSYFPTGFNLPLSQRNAAAEGTHRLDWYSYYYAGSFRVSPDDFCGDMGPGAGDFPILIYIPAVKITLGSLTLFQTPGYPNPLYIDMGELEGRVRRGLELAAQKYVPDYERDVLDALKPQGDPQSFLNAIANFASNAGKGTLSDPEVFLPTSWTGHTPGLGAVVTPVVRLVDFPTALRDLQSILDTIQRASYKDNLLNAAKYPYYYDVFQTLVRRLGISFTLPSVAQNASDILTQVASLQGNRDPKARGIWPLEELKRYFPPSLPQVHEALGYATYFQVFGKLETYPLPDSQASWSPGEYPIVAFYRSPHKWNIPLVCPVEWGGGCYPDAPNIRPIFIAPYTLMLAGPRYYYDWVSVPDGYPIPRVEGLPVPVIPLPKR